MEPLDDLLGFMAGTPALVGPILTALVIYLTANWRLSLASLLVQYVLVGLALTRFVRSEVAFVKILAGILVVVILYLTARRFEDSRQGEEPSEAVLGPQGRNLGWLGGPLGLPLRSLSIFFLVLALLRLFPGYSIELVSEEVALVVCWLAGMGLLGLILSDSPLRVAAATFTILTGFDLVYSSLEPSLGVAGFLGAFNLMAALAFSYLIVVRSMPASRGETQPEVEP